MRSSLATRLKALSPPQLALVACGSLALAGGGIMAAAGPMSGPDVRDQAFTGGDDDRPRGLITKRPETTERVSQGGEAPSRSGDRKDGAAAGERSGVRPSATSPASGAASAPAGSGGSGGASDAGGPQGDTGASGPKGDTGGAGPTGDGEVGNGTAPSGPSGDTGSGGPSTPGPSAGTAPPRSPGTQAPTPAPAPAVLVVKDANGTTAGTLLSGDPNADWLTFSYKDRMYLANAQTGALDLPQVETSYLTDHCTGTPYASLSRPARSVLRSANPGETGIYEFGQPRSVDVRSIWQPGEQGAQGVCLQYVYTTDLAPLNELSASERPPTLTGPLKAVPAG